MIDFKIFKEEFLKGTPKIKEKLDKVLMLNLMGAMGVRIHNEGRATDGSQIGEYSEMAKEIREEKGQQTDYVDLQDTGELAGSLNVGTVDGDNVLGYEEIMYGEDSDVKDTIENLNKQEEHFGKEIFSPSEKEIDEAYEGAEKSISDDLDKLINLALDKAIKNDPGANS